MLRATLNNRSRLRRLQLCFLATSGSSLLSLRPFILARNDLQQIGGEYSRLLPVATISGKSFFRPWDCYMLMVRQIVWLQWSQRERKNDQILPKLKMKPRLSSPGRSFLFLIHVAPNRAAMGKSGASLTPSKQERYWLGEERKKRRDSR